MKVLFLGGYGNISWHCTQKALEEGHEVYLLNRSLTVNSRREIPKTAKLLTGDIRNPKEIKELMANLEFDCICDFICFDEEQAKFAVEHFKGKTKQYIFISTEAIYKREPKYLPFNENTPKCNPEEVCPYIAGKIKAEEIFLNAHNEGVLPVTIVRPGYTYDTIIPVSLGHNCFTAPQRALNGKPLLIGDNGESLWTFTHSSDFAQAFTALLGNEQVMGDAVHITSDFVYSWNDAMKILADTLGVENPRFLHIPKDTVLESELGTQKELATLKMFDSVFDNSKIKSLVPDWNPQISLEEGLKQTLNWLLEDNKRMRIVPQLNEVLEKLEEENEKLSRL